MKHTTVYPSGRKPASRERGSTRQRGYDAEHFRLRAGWEPRVAAGQVDCARCGQPIQPGEPWDLGHNDDRSGYNGPEHAACNRSAAGRKRGRTRSRDW